MRIADVIRRKGDSVATIGPEELVSALLERLSEHKVGALVVLSVVKCECRARIAFAARLAGSRWI